MARKVEWEKVDDGTPILTAFGTMEGIASAFTKPNHEGFRVMVLELSIRQIDGEWKPMKIALTIGDAEILEQALGALLEEIRKQDGTPTNTQFMRKEDRSHG